MSQLAYFNTANLDVGYNNKTLIKDINISVNKGEILTLIGPNGSGKSTILKSIIRQLQPIGGVVTIGGEDIYAKTAKQLAQQISVVLTERISPELMTCYDIAATGRYPYTSGMGILSAADRQIVYQSLEMVSATQLAEKNFNEISDGQRQRIMLARAICQQPEIIVLDEPTSFLDIKYKIELLNILRNMATKENIAVIMSLHEIDLVAKISDKVICVKGENISRYGTVEEVFAEDIITQLYEVPLNSYHSLFGSVELAKPQGKSSIFVFAGNGSGIPIYRQLQKKNLAFTTGLLYENDMDFQVAKYLAQQVVSQKAFTLPTNEHILQIEQLTRDKIILDAVGDHGEINAPISDLIKKLAGSGEKIYRSLAELQADHPALF